MAGLVSTSPTADVTAIKDQTDNLAGETPVDDSVTANWQSGTATSGETGADLVTIGTASVWKKLHCLIVDINALTAAATITVRLYKLVNGTERKIYDQDFKKGTDPDGLWIVTGSLEIYGQVRVEVQSNNASDDGLAVAYEYTLEDM